ncbi:coiled-coil domain-containing protein [Curtobacterium sp. NPDC089689]|uniref:coiled-coil domain-containing protein n=1 Tax=Curtobacterium sp. NPDC089689 TaxID=3363968 RepID=UPI00382B6AD9
MRLPLSGRGFVVAAVVAGVLVAPLVTAAPASATTYPTWQDVQRAKGDEQAKKAEVDRVQTALQQVQADAAAKSAAAITASEAADRADADLATATQTATSLQAQADSASATAERAQQRAGQLAANLYRDGATDQMSTRIATTKDPGQLLYQLGALDQLSSTWAGVMGDASVAAGTASSLHEQAKRAEDERADLASAAEAKAADAKSAQVAADEAVDDTQQHSDELYAQLASLQDTTASEERGYQLGLQVAAQKAEQQRRREEAAERQREQQAVAAAGSSSSASSGSTSGGSGTNYPSTGGVVVDPAGAQAYARSAIGAYGWGSDQMGCLVSLWTQESGWRANALNVSSGAYGIPQALPADKMAVAGADWRTNAATQINWGLAYIHDAYGSPCGAWNHEMSVNPHWY